MQYDKWIRSWKSALAENFFLRSLCLLLGFGLLLNTTIFRKHDRIIISPPQTTKQYWVDSKRASPEYLEQMAVFFALLGGNLSPMNAEYQISQMLQYIDVPLLGGSHIKTDLAAQAMYIKKNNITQAFFPSSVKVDPATNSVKVMGTVIRNIGTTKISEEIMIINMKFNMKDYRLWLTEYTVEHPREEKVEKKEQIKEEKEKKEKKAMEAAAQKAQEREE